jgi:hypothetical protein
MFITPKGKRILQWRNLADITLIELPKQLINKGQTEIAYFLKGSNKKNKKSPSSAQKMTALPTF